MLFSSASSYTPTYSHKYSFSLHIFLLHWLSKHSFNHLPLTHTLNDVPDVSFLLRHHLTAPTSPPRYFLLQEAIHIFLAFDVALKLVLLKHLIARIYITLPHLLTPPVLLFLHQPLLMPFKELAYAWPPQNRYIFVGE